MARRFGLIVVGDEILSGRRQDKHLSKVIELLAQRQQELAWARYLGDELPPLTAALKDSFASGDIVFVTGGIGATPDDRTRQAAAEALAVALEPHPEGVRILEEKFDGDIYPNRVQMAHFPHGADLIPNPVNQVAGFSIREHYFVPGFPSMAWPMLAWVLDNHYASLAASRLLERSLRLYGAYESLVTPLLHDIEQRFAVHTFSLPSTHKDEPFIELGVKAQAEPLLDEAFAYLLAQLGQLPGVAIQQ